VFTKSRISFCRWDRSIAALLGSNVCSDHSVAEGSDGVKDSGEGYRDVQRRCEPQRRPPACRSSSLTWWGRDALIFRVNNGAWRHPPRRPPGMAEP
jgi:hypothetical protein